jgi:thioredoxin
MKAKHWYDYLWIYAIIYFALGFFNILFAWLGMIDFLLPLFLAIFGGNKFFCNHLCGRGQLFSKLGTDLKCSRCKPTPRWMSSKWFRYGFLLFFLTMFGNMVFQTYLVAAGAASLRETIKLFWTFRVPWSWTYTGGTVADWVAQFSFGFYSLMLTSLLLGLIVMVLYKPRTWCAFCPMGTITQGICKLKKKNYKSSTKGVILMTELKITAANFENEVLRSDKPVLLDFYADWCGPCKMLSPILHELAEEKSGTLKVGKVNVDEQMELAMRFQVSSIPMLVVFKDGKAVAKSVGYRPKSEIAAMVEGAR